MVAEKNLDIDNGKLTILLVLSQMKFKVGSGIASEREQLEMN